MRSTAARIPALLVLFGGARALYDETRDALADLRCDADILRMETLSEEHVNDAADEAIRALRDAMGAGGRLATGVFVAIAARAEETPLPETALRFLTTLAEACPASMAVHQAVFCTTDAVMPTLSERGAIRACFAALNDFAAGAPEGALRDRTVLVTGAVRMDGSVANAADLSRQRALSLASYTAARVAAGDTSAHFAPPVSGVYAAGAADADIYERARALLRQRRGLYGALDDTAAKRESNRFFEALRETIARCDDATALRAALMRALPESGRAPVRPAYGEAKEAFFGESLSVFAEEYAARQCARLFDQTALDETRDGAWWSEADEERLRQFRDERDAEADAAAERLHSALDAAIPSPFSMTGGATLARHALDTLAPLYAAAALRRETARHAQALVKTAPRVRRRPAETRLAEIDVALDTADISPEAARALESDDMAFLRRDMARRAEPSCMLAVKPTTYLCLTGGGEWFDALRCDGWAWLALPARRCALFCAMRLGGAEETLA